MNGTGGRGRWTALPKRALDRRRLEHKHQGSQTPVHQPCAHPETWDPTLLKHGAHGEKGAENPLGVCFSSTSLEHRFSGPLPGPKMLPWWGKRDLPIHVGQGLHTAEGVNHNSQLRLQGLGRNQPQGSCQSGKVCSLMSPFLMAPWNLLSKLYLLKSNTLITPRGLMSKWQLFLVPLSQRWFLPKPSVCFPNLD